MAYMLYAKYKHGDPENDMEIECDNIAELARYASACIEQGYQDVRAVIE